MKSKWFVGLILLQACSPCFAQKKDPEISKLLTVSQYVFVETIYGPVNDTTLDPRVTPEDRGVVYRVEDALRTWGRYRLTTKRGDAGLVFVVRKGQLAAAHAGVRVSRVPQTTGGPSQTRTSAGPEFGGEVGPPYDLLYVYTRNWDGSLGAPLWRRTEDHGLDTPDLPLFKKFKEAIEAATKAQAKRTP